MQTMRFPGGLALRTGKNPSAHLASGFSLGWAKDLPRGRLQLATVKCCWQPINGSKRGKKGRKKHLAQCFSQAPVSMGTASPGGLVSDRNRYVHQGATSSELNYVFVVVFFTYQLQALLLKDCWNVWFLSFSSGLVVVWRQIQFETSFFFTPSPLGERVALCHQIICQPSCPTANSFSFRQNKRLHYSGCHLSRMALLLLCQAVGLHTYQQICLLFTLEDISFQQSPFRALLSCANPKACARQHARGSHSELKPQRGMFSADLLDSDESECCTSAAVKCCTLPPAPANHQRRRFKHVHAPYIQG